MPLNVASLSNELASNFAAPGADAGACAQQWAAAVQAYAAAVVPPSLTLAAAASALQSGLASAFGSPNAIPGMESALASFGASLAGGMAPTFTGVPPAGPVGFAALFGGAAPETHGAAGSAVASNIDTWMKTGSATLVAPPFTVSPWT